MRTKSLPRPVLAGLAVAVVAVAGTAVALTAGGAASAAPTADAALSATLDQVLANPRLAGSIDGMQVRDAATGSLVYSRNADQRVVPASNEKLMTSAAALEVLGPTYTFHTLTSYSGTRSGSTVSGDIYLRGQGDPTLTYAEFDKLATAVAKAGITKVGGGLVADDSWFDHVPLGLDWSWQDETYADNAVISALTVAATDRFDTGSLSIAGKAGSAAGKPAVLTITPANSVVTIVNKTTTGAAGSADTVNAVRTHGTNTVVVSGSSPLKATAAGIDLVSVQDPTKLAAGVFRDALKRHGVTVAGPTSVAATPSGTKTITDHASIPLSKLLPSMLKFSNNGHAELLVKAMSRAKSPTAAGNWAGGLAAGTAALKAIGVDTSVLSMGDGSGLSRRDWLTTGQVAALLTAARSRPWFSTFYAALPIAGDPDPNVGGTLTNRMRNTPAAGNVHAKTGTLTAVNALSGYVTDRTGRRLVFSSIANNALSNVSDILDSAAVAMASSGGPALTARKLPAVEAHVVTRAGSDVECSWVPGAC